MNDKRSFSRITPEFQVIVIDGNSEIRGKASSISLKGLFLKEIKLPTDGRDLLVKIPLDELNSVEARAIVRRTTDEGSGFEFLEILGNDSWYHLKNLVLYNIKDQHAFVKELEAHVGIKGDQTSQ